jgi:catechol 2,3-dioxygenase-like lactoylglutathione lyase family enzyme
MGILGIDSVTYRVADVAQSTRFFEYFGLVALERGVSGATFGTPEHTTVLVRDAEEIAVVLDGRSITREPGEMDAGVVEFVVTNGGSEPHELVVIRSDAETSALPVVDGLVPESDVDFEGEVGEFPAGSIRSGTFSLEAG